MAKANTFTLNGKTYLAQNFSYNTICDLQDLGVDIDKMGDRGASMNRAFLSIWTGMSIEEAGNEIGAHMMNGGTLDELSLAIARSMEESDFFQKLNESKDQKKTPTKRAKKEENEE